MGLIITNGDQYILHTETGEFRKTNNIKEAEIFSSVNRATKVIKGFGSEVNNYYVFDTDTKKICWKKHKRKKYSKTVRKLIYEKADKRCELCGRKIRYKDMTLDHIVPLAMGGQESVDNLQCTCQTCNMFKGHTLPDDFMERISQIFVYQVKKKNVGKIRWKILSLLLQEFM